MSEFFVDILDSSDNKLDDGPLASVTSISDTRKLDQIGSASFTIPAADKRTELITAGRKFDIYDRVDGYIGRFYYKSKSLDESGQQAMLTVNVYDQLKELSYESVNFRRTYTDTDPATIIAEIIALVSGWSATVDADLENVSVIFEGESVFRAIDSIRETLNKHLRLGSASELEFGAFGEDSGVRLTNLLGQVQANIETLKQIAIVDKIALVEESAEIFNRVIPLGAGQGVSQLTLEQATYEGSYTVQTGTNADSSSFYYLEDSDSVAAYGTRTKILSFPDISPITNSDANIVNAANVLKITAEEWLKQHIEPTVTYSVSVVGLRENVNVGDTVRLEYRGRVDNYSYIDINDDFYVTAITRNRNADGSRTANLTISSTATVTKADTDIIADVVNDISVLKVHVPQTLAYAPIGPYTRRMNSTNDAEFTARIGDEVTYLNYAILRFRTFPLRSSITTIPSGGGGTTPSGGGSTTPSGGGSTSGSQGGPSYQHGHIITLGSGTGGTAVYYNGGAFYTSGGGDIVSGIAVADLAYHTHTTPAHTHSTPNHTHTTPNHTHTVTYGLYEDTTYPQVISIEINGVDRTVALGGTWAPANSSVEEELDITTYLVDAVGGLRQNHRIVFSCTTGQGEVEVEIDMLVTIQAIAVA